eukprot:TRINITY_DN675_c0_g1_i2.p1 TRINITY_DN675_c0_g1~~TRINITY_DN675_c0_g1_i2.p1  ORF type:complete len:846 (+),score=186.92 TRINITY_DN675_c0_g1_i2:48-2540(+)
MFGIQRRGWILGVWEAEVILVLCLVLGCLAIGIAPQLFLVPHSSMLDEWESYVPLVGLVLSVFTVPATFVSFLILLHYFLKSMKLFGAKLLALVSAILLLLACMSMCVYKLIRPWIHVFGTEPEESDMLSVYWGVLCMVVLVPFTVLFCVILVQLVSHKIKSLGSHKLLLLTINANDPAQQIVKRQGNRPYVPILGFGLAIPVVIFATMMFPPLWYVPYLGEGNYSQVDSYYSLITNSLHMKLYVDVVVFFAFFYGVVLVTMILNRTGRLAHLLHAVQVYSMKVPPALKKISSFSITIGYGEMTFWLCAVGLAIWWFWFWFAGYGRIAEMPRTWERLARVMGHMTNLFMSLAIFPVTRNSIWVDTIGIPFERAVRFHRTFGALTFLFMTAHMLTWWVEWLKLGTFWHNLVSVRNAEHADNWSIPLAEIAWLCTATLAVFSLPYFRRNHFEVFYYTHFLFLVVFIIGLIHSWSLWYFLSGPLLLWVIDRLVRYYRGSKKFVLLSMEDCAQGEITKLVVATRSGFSFRPGHYCFVQIPEISLLEWHPFTISSTPGDSQFTLHIKNFGPNTWTQQLNHLARARTGKQNTSIPDLTINVDGPYGAPPDFSSSQIIVLLAGGIGVTPMHAHLKDLYQRSIVHHPEVRHIKQVHFIWVVRSVEVIDMFRETLEEIAALGPAASMRFFLYLHVTPVRGPRSDVLVHAPGPAPGAVEDARAQRGSTGTPHVPGDAKDSPTAHPAAHHSDIESASNLVINHGRPNLKTLFEQINTRSVSGGLTPTGSMKYNSRRDSSTYLLAPQGKVSLSVCGPQPMVDEAVTLAYPLDFEVHTETFEL